MLIEFKVANFRSVKEEQTFSMVASKGKELVDSNTFQLEGFKNRSLRSAVIYGPNASGKTNLLRALNEMRGIVLESHVEKSQGDAIPVVPFKLDAKNSRLPSRFEVVFVVGGVCYEYGFSATKKRVVDEWLFVSPEGRRQLWFQRKDTDFWKIGNSLKGEKELWRKSTRDNALFLSTAIQLNSEQLKPVFDWFKETLRLSIGFEALLQDPFGGHSLFENINYDNVLNILKRADLGIGDFRIEKQKVDKDNLGEFPKFFPDSFSQVLTQAVAKEMKGKDSYEVKTIHKDNKGNPVEFDLGEESSGTINAFILSILFVESLRKGQVVFIDELNNSLHPSLVKFLVGLFNNSKTNPKNAQLVFTTHETSMLNQELLRRDQIWFCEKNEEQATQVYPLSDFHPRKGVDNLELAYRSGRYGALPYVAEIQ